MQQLADRIAFLRDIHGGLRAAARATGIDVGYLRRMYIGAKINPSDETLAKLGLKKEVIYVVK